MSKKRRLPGAFQPSRRRLPMVVAPLGLMLASAPVSAQQVILSGDADPSDRTSIASGDDLEIGRTGVASLRWDQRVQKRIVIDGEERIIDGFEVVQEKNAKRTGGKKLFLPITPMLAEALAPLKVDDGTVLKTGYGRRPRPSRSLAPWLIGPTWKSCRLA